MSDDTQDPKKPAPATAAAPAAPAAPPGPAAPAAEKGATAPRPAAKKPQLPAFLTALPLVPIAVIVLALGAGVAVGSLLVAPPLIKVRQAAAADAGKAHGKKDKKKKASGDKKGEAGKPTVYKLDNIIVNPADSQGQRFLMCSVAIESDDPKALDMLRAHEIELRDEVVTMLSQRSLERLTAPGARDSLRADLRRLIRPALGPDADDTDLRVYLPQFVVQ